MRVQKILLVVPIAWLLGNLLLGCEANLKVTTNEADLDCAKLTEDTYCVKVRNGQRESVKDLAIDQAEILSSTPSFQLSWKMPETAKGILASKVILASDQACTEEVQTTEIDLKEQSYNFSNIADGIYFGCIFAKARAAGLIGAKNNGIRIVVETAELKIKHTSKVLHSNGKVLNPELSIAANNAVSYLWVKTDGVGDLIFTNPNVLNPSFSATVDGLYTVRLEVQNEIGAKTSELFTFVYDSTPPVLSDIAWAAEYSPSAIAPLTWTDGSDNNFFTHKLKACTNSACSENCTAVTEDSASPGTIGGMSPGIRYHACIQAIDLAGNSSSYAVSGGTITIDSTGPAAPAAIAWASAYSSSTSASLTWANGSDSNFSSHNLKACTNSGCSANCTTITQDAATPGSISGMTDGNRYYACLQTVDRAGNSSAYVASLGTLTIDLTNPNDPTAVSVPTASNANFNISFTAGAELNPAGFIIKACTSGCTSGCVGETSTASSPGTINAAALTNGNSYRGCVRATDEAGNTSNWVASSGLVIFDTLAPNGASNLSVPAYSNNSSVAVAFTVGSDANMNTHNFKACTSNNCTTGCLTEFQAASSPATLTSLVNGTAYYACGQAIDLAGNASAFSFSPATVTIDMTAPSQPTAVSVPAASTTSFNISFTAGTEIYPGNFNIKACANSDCSTACVGATTTATSPGTISSAALTLGTSYYGCVQGTDLAGNTSNFVPSAGLVIYNAFAVTYNGNGSTGGTVPTDAGVYASGATATVLGNTGPLVKTGYTFDNWNTAKNGSGTAYNAAQTFSIAANTILYAQWNVNCNSLAGGAYVMVPGDSDYGTSSFCIQKYAASNVSNVPTSQAGTAPWAATNQSDAIARCAALGAGFHLLTNPEWMTVAANLANVGSNWSSGTVGSGYLRRGHSDNDPGNACEANASDAHAYVETDCSGTNSGSFDQRRTSSLSNGSIVWDIGGNISSRINYYNANDKPTPSSWSEAGSMVGTTSTPKAHLVPLNSVQPWWSDSWSSGHGIGQFSMGGNGSGGSLVRGGYWLNGTRAGAFTIGMSNAPWWGGADNGLRCAYTPNTFAVSYDANSATSGSPPHDPTLYASGNKVTVQNNSIALDRTGYTFAGWNTLANGTGTNYTPGGTFTISANTTLYANWINCTGLAGGTYVAVPGDSIYGTKAFCVQKYAATNVGGVPTAQAGGGPWISSSWNNARTVCSALGAGYHLITNPEWMTIAANLANVGSNWSGGTVGSGALRRGHMDMDPFAHCATHADDTYAWVQTNCNGTNSGAFSERRTSTLSNGVVVWDIGGNVWNFVDYNNNADKPTPATADWYEFTAITGSTTTPRSHLVPINSVQPWWNDSWQSSNGIGLIIPGVNGGSGGGSMERGGYFTGGAGAFSMRLSLFGGSSSSQTAMRCVYQP